MSVHFFILAQVGKSSKRVPMFLTTSLLEASKYGEAYYQLRERLGLEEKDESLRFLRNTAMNPFQASEGYIPYLSKLFRSTILNSIGGVRLFLFFS